MFGHSALRRTLEAALRDVEERSPAVRVSALADLTFHADSHRGVVLSALERALRDPMPQVRSAAAVGLADLRAVEALPSLLVAIEDEHPLVRQMALTALGELGDGRTRERLRRALSDERPDVRFQAIIAFCRVAPDEADDALAVALEDPDAHVRYIAVRSAEERTEEGRSPLSVRLEARLRSKLEDPDPVVRVGAAVALARSGWEPSTAVLLAAVDGRVMTREVEDEFAAIELCGELGLEGATPALERKAFGLARLLHPTLAWQATIALARLGHSRAKQVIAGGLSSRSRVRRTMAVAAAGRARQLELRPTIEKMLGSDAMAEQDAVSAALTELASGAAPIVRPLPALSDARGK